MCKQRVQPQEAARKAAESSNNPSLRSLSHALSSSLTLTPLAQVEAVIRPWRLSHVIKALSEGGIRGVTAYEVTGLGAQGGGVRERYAGHEFDESSLVAKTKLEVVVVAAQVNDVVNLIIAAAQTGEVGDGKLFVSPVSDVIRIRTAEHGAAAERMKGGREDMKRAASTDAN